MKTINLKDLRKEIPYQWRVQSFSQSSKKASCIAYIDARDVQNLLDEVVGAENWQVDYKTVGNMFMAGIGIKTDDGWIWKWDTGSESNVEKEKGHVSDAFKRAAVHWGIGRFLYEKEIVWVDTDSVKDKNVKFNPNVIDKNGKKVWDLTKHINGLNRQSHETNTQEDEGIQI